MTPTCLSTAYRSTQKHKHDNDVLYTDSTGDWWGTLFFDLTVFFEKTWLLWILSSLLLKRTNIFDYWAFLSSHLTYGNLIPINPINSLTEKLNQKLYGYREISLTLSLKHKSTCSNSFNNSLLSSSLLSYRKGIIKTVARLYNGALKIHGNLPLWTHHCAALSHCNAMTFQNYINIHATKFYYQIYNNNWSPVFTAVFTMQYNTRSLSQVLIPVPAYRNSYGQRSMIRGWTFHVGVQVPSDGWTHLQPLILLIISAHLG